MAMSKRELKKLRLVSNIKKTEEEKRALHAKKKLERDTERFENILADLFFNLKILGLALLVLFMFYFVSHL